MHPSVDVSIYRWILSGRSQGRQHPSFSVSLHTTSRESRVANVYMPLQLAPNALSQPILPNWSFNLFTVNLGATSNAEIEQEALEKVGSYGKQIGHLAEALEVLIQKLKILDRTDLSEDDRDALQVFLGDVSAIRQIKSGHE